MDLDWTTLGASVITLAGVLLTLLLTGSREERRSLRERDWADAAWAREQRAAAHLKVLAVHRELSHSVVMRHRVGGLDDPADTGPIPHWIDPLSAALLPVRVFGSPEAALAADRLFLATMVTERDGAPLGHLTRMNAAAEAYRRTVQADLGVPVTELLEEEYDEPWQDPPRASDCLQPECGVGSVLWRDQVVYEDGEIIETFGAGRCDKCDGWTMSCPDCHREFALAPEGQTCATCGRAYALVIDDGETVVLPR